MPFRQGILGLIVVFVLALCVGACGGSSGATSTGNGRRATPAVESISPPVPLTPVSPPGAQPFVPAPLGLSLNPGPAFMSGGRGWLARGSSEGGRILVTNDGGATWTTQYTGDVLPQVLAFADDTHGWAAGCATPAALGAECQSKLLATSDGGARWSAIPTFRGGDVVGMAFVSAEDGWALTDPCESTCGSAPARLYATRDGGASWSSLPLPDSNVPLEVRRTDAGHGWVVTQEDVLVTKDGGESWDAVTNPCLGAFAGAAISLEPVDFADALHGWLGCSGDAAADMGEKVLYDTVDGGMTWKVIATTPPGMIPDGITPPAGGRWLNSLGSIADLDFTDEMNGWMAPDALVGGLVGFLYKTSDGGRTWDAVDSGSNGAGIEHVTFVDRADGWASGDVAIWRTTDGGASWELLPTAP